MEWPRPTRPVQFASFLSGGFITVIVVNPLESKLEKRTSVQWSNLYFSANSQPEIRILNGLYLWCLLKCLTRLNTFLKVSLHFGQV